MKFFLALLLWIGMAAALAAGCVLAVLGKPWLLIIGTLVFLGLFAKIGCMSHD